MTHDPNFSSDEYDDGEEFSDSDITPVRGVPLDFDPPKHAGGRPKETPANRRASLFIHAQRARDRELLPHAVVAGWLESQSYPFITCPYCNKKCTEGCQVNIDHKIPQVIGGSSGLENLQLICSSCNRRKGCHTHKQLIHWAAKVLSRFQAEVDADLKEQAESRELFSFVGGEVLDRGASHDSGSLGQN